MNRPNPVTVHWLLTTAEVAREFQVSTRTVLSWAKTGRVPSFLTPGGARRYPADEIRVLAAAQVQEVTS